MSIASVAKSHGIFTVIEYSALSVPFVWIPHLLWRLMINSEPVDIVLEKQTADHRPTTHFTIHKQNFNNNKYS